MLTSPQALTCMQIGTLRTEAAAAGDSDLVTICDMALKGNVEARALACEAINACEAMNDDHDDDGY